MAWTTSNGRIAHVIPDDPERVRLLEQSLQWAKQVHGSFEIVGMPASGSRPGVTKEPQR